MSRFPTVKYFTSWLGLCPGTRIGGGKVLGAKSRRTANRATQALGAFYRRMSARMDKPKAVTAAAHKLARIIYIMLTRGEEYTDRGQQYFEERYRERVVCQLTKKARELGLAIVPAASSAQPA